METAAHATTIRRVAPGNDPLGPNWVSEGFAASTSPNGPTFRLATSEDDHIAVYRLRYDLYVEDQGLFLDLADHRRRWLYDDYDPCSSIVMAELEGELVGTIRMTFGSDAKFSPASREEYDFDRFSGVVDDADQSIITRLVVRKDLRGGSLGRDLLHKAFELAALRGAELILGSCEVHLVNYYLKLGFRTFGALDSCGENGVLVRIAAVMGDLEHFERIASPMVSAVAMRHRPCPDLAAILSQVEGGAAVTSESHLGTELFRKAADDRTEADGSDKAQFLATLSPRESERLLRRGHLLDCAPGDRLVLEGHQTRVPFILLSGALAIRDADGRPYRLDRPGALVGEVALLAATRRPSDFVAAAEGARVLAFDDRNLRTLLAEHGPLASKFYAFAARELSHKLLERSTPRARPEAPPEEARSPETAEPICRSLPFGTALGSRRRADRPGWPQPSPAESRGPRERI